MIIEYDITKNMDNIVLFTNGAIGDSLMGMLCANSVAEKLAGSTVIILTPRNVAILRDLFSAYPNIHVREVNRRNFLHAVTLTTRVIWQKNVVMNHGVFIKPTFFIGLLTRLLTMRHASFSLHFAQKNISDKGIGTGTVVFDYHLPVYENLAHLFTMQNLAVSLTIPQYRFVHDPSVLERYGLARSAYIVVHPCAFNASRSLPVARWANLLKYLAVNFPDLKIVVTGSKQDSHFVQKIANTMDQSIPFINLTTGLSMMEIANILDGARGYVGVDTGITHLASVLQKCSVIIGNRSNPCWLPRYNKNAVILTESKNCTCDGRKGGDCFYYLDKEKYYKCMLDIPEESIFESIKNMLTEGVLI